MATEHFDNLYAENQQNYNEETLPFDEIMKIAIESRLLEMHVCLPCYITKIEGNGYVSVQPTLETLFTSQLSNQVPGTFNQAVSSPLPVIQGVPVLLPSGQNWWISAPLAVNDVGIVLFSERSLDNWSVSSGTDFVDPQDTRKFDLSDGIFVPGIRTMATAIPSTGTDFELHNGSANLSLGASGTFNLSNGTNELLSVINELISDLISATTVLGGPFTPGTIAALEAVQAKLATLQA